MIRTLWFLVGMTAGVILETLILICFLVEGLM